ncbi:MAG TPA: type II and III secretion system protein family protein [Sphingomicrobium sp.]|jgi:pilus assembly protein CpaC
MKTVRNTGRARLGTAVAALAIGLAAVAAPTAAMAQPRAYTDGTYRPTAQVALSTGEGTMINLPRRVTNVWVSNPKVADVLVNSPTQLNLFGKEFGETTLIATAADGSVVYGAQVHVSQNLPTINEVLRAAMPDARVNIMTVGQTAILTGTVASPEDSAFVEDLANRELNPGVDMSAKGAMCKICVLNRLKVATPLQVMLKVRIAEMNRSALKTIGVNLLGRDSNPGGTFFGIGQGNPGDLGNGQLGGRTFNFPSEGTGLGLAGKLFGLDLLGTLDLLQNDGVVSTLAEPNLTALSGETASFLAGGEFPIPVSQGNNAVSVEFKTYGVSLAFTPIVLADGRISLRVRPEVSQLSDAGSVTIGGFVVPALTTRRAETTVELGSGQSFMLAGLLQNTNTNSVKKAPFLGDLPILGALFRSTSFQRNETELVIVVTPYLVRPTSTPAALPTNGYRAPTDPEQILLGQTHTGVSGPAGLVPSAVSATVPANAAVAPAPGFRK